MVGSLRGEFPHRAVGIRPNKGGPALRGAGVWVGSGQRWPACVVGGPCMSVSEQIQVEQHFPGSRSGVGPPRRRWMRRYLAAVVVLDACAATAAAVTAYLVRFSDGAIG